MSKHIVIDKELKKVASQYTVIDGKLRKIKQEFVVKTINGIKTLKKVFDDRVLQLKGVFYSVESKNATLLEKICGYQVEKTNVTGTAMAQLLYSFAIDKSFITVKTGDELIISGQIKLTNDTNNAEKHGITYIGIKFVDTKSKLSLNDISNITFDKEDRIETVALNEKDDILDFDYSYTVEKTYDGKNMYICFQTEIGSGCFEVSYGMTLCGVNLLATKY
jgi:hypothetical protein